jgi:crotonobetainyl-CoA:carnitine CoA-transferase CaiB-like acyl-CoA transferase
MDEWGLDPATLRARNERLVCVRMTGFGLTGPDRDQVSFGPTLQARAGYTALMAGRDGVPIGFGFSYADVASGHLAALAVVAALWRRQCTGEGAVIDFSQLEAVAALLGPTLLEHAAGHAFPGSGVAPEGVYPCAGADRWIAITVATDDDWRRFAAALGAPPWTREERFATASDRVRARAALDDLVASWTRTRDADAAMDLLQRAGVAAGRVASARDLYERDPQLAARGFFVEVATSEGRTARFDGLPFRLSETPPRIAAAGPLVGEHTRAVLRSGG